MTDEKSRLSKAITFKNQRVGLGDLAASHCVSQSSLNKSSDTFSLMGSTKDSSGAVCPANLFYHTLIALFAPEPKTFLVESPAYLRPILFLAEADDTEIPFAQLQHRTHYRLRFVEPAHET